MRKENEVSNFLTTVNAEVKGYSTRAAEMHYTPQGDAVTSVWVGCGGKENTTTFVKISVWRGAAEKLNEVCNDKGIKVIAFGVIRVSEWERREGGRGYCVELIYVNKLEVAVGDRFVEIPIVPKGDEEKGEGAAAGR
jgi:hypothetical protein